MVATRGRRWRQGRRDQRDVQRSEVRLDGVGARRPVAARADRGRPRQGRGERGRYLREQVPVVRRRYSGQVVEEYAKDVIAAEYRHTTARGVSGAQAPIPSCTVMS